jgi:hypothetical protein
MIKKLSGSQTPLFFLSSFTSRVSSFFRGQHRPAGLRSASLLRPAGPAPRTGRRHQYLPLSQRWRLDILFICFKQCWGSGSAGAACFWASRIRIRIH